MPGIPSRYWATSLTRRRQSSLLANKMKKNILICILLFPLFLFGNEEQNIIDSALEIIREQGFADEIESPEEKKFLLLIRH